MDTSKIVDEVLEHRNVMELPVSQLVLRTDRIDSRFVDRGITLKRTDAIWNKVNKIMVDIRLPFINAKPEYKKAYAEGTINSADNNVAQKYYREVANTYFDQYKIALSNPGTKKYIMILDEPPYLGFMIKTVHTIPTNDDFVRIALVRDAKGWIIGFDIVDPIMEQSSMIIDDILKHHGVKGQKWGVRRKATVGSTEVVVRDNRKKIKTSGGKGLPAHADAVRARTLGQKGKASGLKALSDQELRAYANRLQLEQNVSRLNFNEKSAPRRFVASLLGRQGSQLANEAAKTGAAKAGRSALNRGARGSVRVAKVAAAVSAA